MGWMSPRTILLINPWIHDVAAYDFWVRPLGLLYLASLLRAGGFSVRIIDCLDSSGKTPPAALKRKDWG